jgi:ssDNA-binding Zn-finger/Zn-ribbon topoisomerase 1
VKEELVTRPINDYQRDYRRRYGCPECRAIVTSRQRFKTDEHGQSKYAGTFDACANYKAGNEDCTFYISNIGKSSMREVAIGDPAPLTPASVYADPKSRIIVRKKPTVTKVDLAKFHTKQLLNVMRMHHRNNAQLDRYAQENYGGDSDIAAGFGEKIHDRESLYEVRTIDPVCFGLPENDKTHEPVTIAQLKAELATREHVPNKKEAKMIRQDKALRGRR